MATVASRQYAAARTHGAIEPRQEPPAGSRVAVDEDTITILGAAQGRGDTRAVEAEHGQVRQPRDARKVPRHAPTIIEVELGQVRQPRDARKVPRHALAHAD